MKKIAIAAATALAFVVASGVSIPAVMACPHEDKAVQEKKQPEPVTAEKDKAEKEKADKAAKDKAAKDKTEDGKVTRR
jgi:hypothetical protein